MFDRLVSVAAFFVFFLPTFFASQPFPSASHVPFFDSFFSFPSLFFFCLDLMCCVFQFGPLPVNLRPVRRIQRHMPHPVLRLHQILPGTRVQFEHSLCFRSAEKESMHIDHGRLLRHCVCLRWRRGRGSGGWRQFCVGDHRRRRVLSGRPIH